MIKIGKRFGIRGMLRGRTRKAVALILAAMTALTACGMAGFAAASNHKVTVFYGYGGKAGSANPGSDVFKADVDAKAYQDTAKTAVTEGDFIAPGNKDNAKRFGWQNADSNIKSVEIVYGDVSANFPIPDPNTEEGTPLNKGVVLSESGDKLSLMSTTDAAKAGERYILTFGKLQGSMLWLAKSSSGLMRFYNIKQDLTVVFHYEDEITFTVNAGSGTVTVPENFPGYSAVKGGTLTGYSMPRGRDTLEPFETVVTAPDGIDVTSYIVTIGDVTATVESADLEGKDAYIDAEGTVGHGDVSAVVKITKDGTITAYDLSEKIDVTPVYASADTQHTVKVVGASGDSNGNATTSSEIEAYVAENKGDYDAATGVWNLTKDFDAKTSGSHTSGLKMKVESKYGTVTGINVKFGDKSVDIKGDNLNSGGFFIKDDGTGASHADKDKQDSEFLKYASSKGYFFRFYKVTTNITITFTYKDVQGEVVDPQSSMQNIEFDAKPHDSLGTYGKVEGNTFTVANGYLRNTDDYSYRITLHPVPGAVINGITVSGGDFSYDFKVEEGKNDTQANGDGTTKVKVALDKGKYFIRVYAQAADKLTFTPDVVSVPQVKDQVKVTLEASPDLMAADQKLGDLDKSNLSADKLTVTVPKGKLAAEKLDDADKTFSWVLGSTMDDGLEYAGVKVYGVDGSGNRTEIYDIGATLPRRIDIVEPDDYKKLEDGVSDNPVIRVRFQKNRNGLAVVRFAVAAGISDFVIVVKYKNYESNEEKLGTAAKFDSTQTVTVKAPNSTWQLDAKVDGTVVDEKNNKVTLNNKNLTGNTPSSGNAGTIRFQIKEKTGYTITGITLSDAAGQVPDLVINLAQKEGSHNPDLVSLSYSHDLGVYYIRVNYIKVRNMVITVDAEQIPDAKFTVKMAPLASGNVSEFEAIPKKDIKGVTVDGTGHTIGISSSKVLPSQKDTESLYWQGYSLYGTDWQYDKLVIHDDDTDAEEILLKDAAVTDYNVNDPKDQNKSYFSSKISVNYVKRKYGDFALRVWGVSGNFTLTVYYKNVKTGEVVPGSEATVNVPWSGQVSFVDSKVSVKRKTFDPEKNNDVVNDKAPLTQSVTGLVKKADRIKYIANVITPGDNVDSLTFKANGKTYTYGTAAMKSNTASDYRILGACVTVAKMGNGAMQVAVWEVMGNISITANLSHGHKFDVTIDEGDHGTFLVTEVPEGAEYDGEMRKITVLQGTTGDPAEGARKSVCYQIPTDVGYEIDKVYFTYGDENVVIDYRNDIKSGSTLYAKNHHNLTIRLAINSDGKMRIRLYNIDTDVHIRLTYREDTYQVVMYPQYGKAYMKAEVYDEGAVYTEFSSNKAVAKVVSGTLQVRTAGIKYHIKPIKEGSSVTHAIVRNHYGDYVVMGDGVGELDYKDYRIKGGVVRYYLAEDGVAEMRVWGVYEDLDILCFYDNEVPDPAMNIPGDIGDHDFGTYPEDSDFEDEEIVEPTVQPEDNDNNEPAEDGTEDPSGKKPSGKESTFSVLPVVLSCIGALLVIAAAIIIILIIKKKRKKEQEAQGGTGQ